MNKASPGPSQLTLVNSKRLHALRKQTSPIEGNKATEKHADASLNQAIPEDAETRRLRLIVRQCLADILSQLPTGKQNSLFKIRFGMSMHEFEQLSPHQAAEVLKIEKRRLKK